VGADAKRLLHFIKHKQNGRATTLNHSKLVQQLLDEVPNRIGQYHRDPQSVCFTEHEMAQLAKAYPIAVILQAMRNMRGVLKSQPNLDNAKMLKSIQNIAQRLLLDGKKRGVYREFNGVAEDGTAVPFVRTTPRKEPARKHVSNDADAETVLSLRIEFQEVCTDQSFTLTEEQAQQCLKQAGSAEVLREAMYKLRKYSVDEFETALADLHAAVDQVLWLHEAMLIQ
jgi:hypothetical protein